MIQKMSHTPVWVLDQDSAKDFYVNKLGFELRDDEPFGEGFRWLTVSPKGQPDLRIILMSTNPSQMLDADTAAKIRALVQEGKMGAGVFATADCQKTYEELSAKGVEFIKKPTKEFYGVEAVLRDDSGNWFSMSEEVEH